jgi:GNAT superfamily N-acetyltransferase
MSNKKVYCWEPSDIGTPVLTAVQNLYERTIDADERIPWMWIERAVVERNLRRPLGWVKRLIVAFDSPNIEDPSSVVGFAYGAFIPGYGGYVCYVGVSETARGLGVGRRLFESMFQSFQADAALANESLPFVIWESRRPEVTESSARHELWTARERLFSRVGGYWMDGVELYAPDYSDEERETAVPLQVFVKPMSETVNSLTSERLQAMVRELLERVYHEKPGSVYYDLTEENMKTVRLVKPVTTLLETAV